MIRPIITAFRTLTIIPLPGKDATNFSHSLVFFPLAGAFIAVCEYAVMIAGCFFVPKYPAINAFFMVLTGVVVTGAIHCDGLADFCDGFFGGKTKEQILSIMKDPRTGSFGVVALIMDLGFRFLLYVILVSEKAFFLIAFSLVVSRLAQAISIAFMPYARPQGGTAAPFCGSKNSKWLVTFTIVVSYFIGYTFSGFMKPGILFSCGIVVTCLVLLVCKRKIGGITGDCIGACSEIVENSVLLCGIILI
jgi:adenosylcobinamide-GDP ribazoletransferase